MISYQQALAIIYEAAQKRELSAERISLDHALGRVCAEDLISPIDVPPFDNSAMDGFALCSAATRDARKERPIRFAIMGCIAAGDRPDKNSSFAKGGPRGIFAEAFEVMTGAQLPSHLGADAVVKIEDVQLIRDANGAPTEFLLTKPISSGENVRRCGSDITQSETLTGKGTRILPEHMMALASVGISELTALRLAKVAVISTGKELVHHSVKALQDGEIYNSTAPYLMSALTKYGASPHFYGIIPDEPHQFVAMINQILLEQPDMVISTGAVSVGKFDFVRACLEDLGATVRFHKVAIRPGKPLLFAELPSIKKDRGPVFFGIPGNPVPAAVCLRFFVEPYMRVLSQMPIEQPIFARLDAPTAKPENLHCFFKAQLKFIDNQAYVSVLEGQESFKVKPLLNANAWAALKSEQSLVEQNTQVEVYPMHPMAKPW